MPEVSKYRLNVHCVDPQGTTRETISWNTDGMSVEQLVDSEEFLSTGFDPEAEWPENRGASLRLTISEEAFRAGALDPIIRLFWAAADLSFDLSKSGEVHIEMTWKAEGCE